MSRRPNLLFLNTDQHRWEALSAHGNPWVHTPNLDRLCERGVSFARSYCTDPVCAPARASWMTGRYTSECGVPFNGGHLHADLPDLGQVLHAAGYNAYHCNKWHVDGRRPTEGFQLLWWGKRPVGAGGAQFYDPVATRAAVDFLARYDDDKPFYLQVGFINPHDLCEVGHNHVGKHIPGPLEQGFVTEADLPPLPDNFAYEEDETVLQIVSRRLPDCLIHADLQNAIRHWGELDWRFFLWQYYRIIEQVDAELGLVLNALENSPHCEDTLVLFSTDHGEAAGCHQMFQKFTLYEESIRVPFVVASMGDRFALDAGTVEAEHFVSGVDLLPTVCDYAEADCPPGVTGLSLRPVLERRQTAWRDFAYVESNYWGRALVSDRFKYATEYVPNVDEDFVPPGPDSAVLGREQLFDLAADPGETRNLSSDRQYAACLQECRDRLQAFERTLTRRPMHPRTHSRLTRWGDRLRDYWERL